MQQVVETITKNKNEQIHVELCEYKDHQLLGMRVWAKTDNGVVPTKKGITVSVKLIPELIAALQKAEAVAIGAGLIGENGKAR